MFSNELTRVLIIDDQDRLASLIHKYLPNIRFTHPQESPDALHFMDGKSALAYLERSGTENIDVILLDIRFDLPEERLIPLSPTASIDQMRRYQGIAILRELRKRYRDLPVILLTTQEDLGFLDRITDLYFDGLTTFLDDEKLDLETLKLQISAAVKKRRSPPQEGRILWGRDSIVQDMRRRLKILSKGSLPLLLEGETGTGKSFLAREYIHPASGRKGSFITLDLSTIPRDLTAAHLFGAKKGSYTGAVADRKGFFQAAHQGTLFLDEIQNASMDVQRQLLIALEEGIVRPLGSTHAEHVDVKLIVATNTSLINAVRAGTFRRDLYMRLNPSTRIVIPPLRARVKDLPFLIEMQFKRAFQDPFNHEIFREILSSSGLPETTLIHISLGERRRKKFPYLYLPKPALKMLLEHAWPGNFRELVMVTHNLVTFTLIHSFESMHEGRMDESLRLTIDPSLVHRMLHEGISLVDESTKKIVSGLPSDQQNRDRSSNLTFQIHLNQASSLNNVSIDLERQVYEMLFRRCRGRFDRMAKILLGDENAHRKVRLRFNQIGLKVRELRETLLD